MVESTTYRDLGSYCRNNFSRLQDEIDSLRQQVLQLQDTVLELRRFVYPESRPARPDKLTVIPALVDTREVF